LLLVGEYQAMTKMDTQAGRTPRRIELTEELRAALHALLSNPLHPGISPEHAQQLTEMGLATIWGDRLAITRAGRVALFAPPESKR
jgi:hypothetical protein